MESTEDYEDMVLSESVRDLERVWGCGDHKIDVYHIVFFVIVYRRVSLVNHRDPVIFWCDSSDLAGLQGRKNRKRGEERFIEEFIGSISHPYGFND
jgi:hypothetical protein